MAENSKISAKRRGPGRPFQPGQSGNHGGRPKGNQQLRASAREHTEKAIAILVSLMGDADPRIRMAAAIEILDRGHGRPTTNTAIDQEEAAAEARESAIPVHQMTESQVTQILKLARANVTPTC